jgi:hypothetical protein
VIKLFASCCLFPKRDSSWQRAGSVTGASYSNTTRAEKETGTLNVVSEVIDEEVSRRVGWEAILTLRRIEPSANGNVFVLNDDMLRHT